MLAESFIWWKVKHKQKYYFHLNI